MSHNLKFTQHKSNKQRAEHTKGTLNKKKVPDNNTGTEAKVQLCEINPSLFHELFERATNYLWLCYILRQKNKFYQTVCLWTRHNQVTCAYLTCLLLVSKKKIMQFMQNL